MIVPAEGAQPGSAALLAELLGDRLARIETVPVEDFALAEQARRLVDAVTLTDADPAERAAVAAELAALADRLEARRRSDAIFLVRHEDGSLENLTNAASGRLNPHALHLTRHGAARRLGSSDLPVELRFGCTLGPSHGGSPGRAHGGVVALLLDQVLGLTATSAGLTGLTGGLNVIYRRGTPWGVPLEVVGRAVRQDGRKSYAEGEIVANGVVTAEATAVFVAERRPPAPSDRTDAGVTDA